MNAFVVAFAGHSGAGKSTLINELAAFLGDVTVLRIDDYESSSYPSAVKWIEDGADPNKFQTPQFFSDIYALKNGISILHPDTNQQVEPTRFLFIEEPFGRSRQAIGELIDFSIYLDTPLEIALTRRLLRLANSISQGVADITIEQHLQWYLKVGRSFYIAVARSARKNCDLTVDGLLSTNDMIKVVNQALKTKLQK